MTAEEKIRFTVAEYCHRTDSAITLRAPGERDLPPSQRARAAE
jgi:hypothetical protein